MFIVYFCIIFIYLVVEAKFEMMCAAIYVALDQTIIKDFVAKTERRGQ